MRVWNRDSRQDALDLWLITLSRRLSDLVVHSEASGESEARDARLLFRSFEANSGDYLTKTIETRNRFPAAATEHPKSDTFLGVGQSRVDRV